jgi:hypothetical protein
VTGFRRTSNRKPGGKQGYLSDLYSRLEDSYGSERVGSFQTVLRAAEERTADLLWGLGLFLEWLAAEAVSERDDSSSLLAKRLHATLVFSGKTHVSMAFYVFDDQRAFQRALLDAVNRWQKIYFDASNGLAITTKYAYVRGAARALQLLSSQNDIGLPSFKSNWVRTWRTYPETDTPCLGQLNWPELHGLPDATRNCAALRLVRDACLTIFLREEALFDFGQAVLHGDDLFPGDPEAQDVIRQGLGLWYHDWLIAQSGRGGFPTLSEMGSKLWAQIANTEIWRRAGFTGEFGPIEGKKFWWLVMLSCCGPTYMAVRAAITMLICDTGWNLQSAAMLPRNPFLFSSAGNTRIGSGDFVSSFKSRAGHDVLGYVGSGASLTGVRVDMMEEVWRETIRNYSPGAKNDGYAVLPSENAGEVTAAQVLRRFDKMAEPIRSLIPDQPDIFWVLLTLKTGPVSPKYRSPKYFDPKYRFRFDLPLKHPVLGREGVTYSAIRKTVLNLTLIETESFSATQTRAQHRSSSVLYPHYLNTAAVKIALDRVTRAFQDSLQAIVVRDQDQIRVAGQLNLSQSVLQAMMSAAREAGIAAVFGLDDAEDTVEVLDRIEFIPDDGRIRELFLIHHALIGLRANCRNMARFRLVYLPLLALVKAIGRELFARTGLGPRYRSIARATYQELKQNRIILPYLES